MLKNRYQEILVGEGLMSLVRGLISLKKGRSTLLIHDPRFESDSYPANFVSELEIHALIRLGKTHDVPELHDLRQFLAPAEIDFITKELRLKLGRSPFENLRELLRKYPELIDTEGLSALYAEGPAAINDWFMSELVRYEAQSYEISARPKGMAFEIQGPKWAKTLYQRFSELLNKEYTDSQTLKFSGLLHFLGLLAEEKLKTRIAPEELPFYFFRSLSPLYRLQDLFLTTQLKRRLILLGGDHKESRVQYWQLYQNKFENLLLASFEGVITGEKVLFFSHLPVEVPFGLSSPWPFYRKTQMAPQKRSLSPFPPTKLTFIADLEALGSERPYRTVAFHKDFAFYQWPYLELPGSKAEFYDRPLIKSFHEDKGMVPFVVENAAPQENLSVSLDMRQLREERKAPGPILGRLPLYITQDDRLIEGFEYWGPFKFRSLGLLALCYGVEKI
jgi:hypothetical protein